MKKIIGIGGNLMFDAAGMFPGYPRAYVNHDYVAAVKAAGAVPLVLPVLSDAECVERQLSVVDGLIITGGYDVNPLLFAEEPHKLLGETLKERDDFDLLLIKTARRLGLPVLGICRGLQILNVEAGGSLYQDCSEDDKCYVRHWQGSNPAQATHTVSFLEDSWLFSIFGTKTGTNSFHHMSIKKIADRFRGVAWAADGTVEGIESVDGPFAAGVQWHPEMMHRQEKMLALFKSFVSKT